MELSDYKKAMMWVASLAVSIAACAGLFFFLANALLDSQRSLLAVQVEQEWLKAKLISLEGTMMQMKAEIAQAHHVSEAATRLDQTPETKTEKTIEPAIETIVAPKSASGTETPVTASPDPAKP